VSPVVVWLLIGLGIPAQILAWMAWGHWRHRRRPFIIAEYYDLNHRDDKTTGIDLPSQPATPRRPSVIGIAKVPTTRRR